MNVRTRRSHKLNKEDVKEIIEMFDSGMRYPEIAKKFNVTPRSIMLHVEKTGRKARSLEKLDETQKDKVVLDFKNGLRNLKELAKKYDSAPDSIKRILKNKDLTPRKGSEAQRKFNVEDYYFDSIDTKEKAYILGLFYADGCNYRPDNKVTISLKTSDQEILKKIKNIIQPDKPLYYKKPYKKGKINSSGHYTLSIISQRISEQLDKWGMKQNKTLNLEWPNFLKDELFSHFVRGFFDGDGGVSNQNGTVIISLAANLEFIIDAKKYLLKKLELANNKIHKNCKSDLYYYCFASKKDVEKFYNWIYVDCDDMYIERKRNKFNL